ncbi:MAG: tRNA(His) guanylyltransferase Thg1 family protein [Candidatus Izemoplasmatales bacterium]
MNKNINSKKIVELESLLNPNYYYVFRADGVDFKEFRVGKLDANELVQLGEVFHEISKLVFKTFHFVKFIYYFDDEINLAFKGNQIGFGRRVQKNLSILSAYISVEFNRLISLTSFDDKLKRKGEYYFDGRFVEIKKYEALIDYFEKEQTKSYVQVKNLLTHRGMLSKKPSINYIIANYLDDEDDLRSYKCLFGCFLSSNLEERHMISTEEELILDITSLIEKSFSKKPK